MSWIGGSRALRRKRPRGRAKRHTGIHISWEAARCDLRLMPVGLPSHLLVFKGFTNIELPRRESWEGVFVGQFFSAAARRPIRYSRQRRSICINRTVRAVLDLAEILEVQSSAPVSKCHGWGCCERTKPFKYFRAGFWTGGKSISRSHLDRALLLGDSQTNSYVCFWPVAVVGRLHPNADISFSAHSWHLDNLAE